VSGNTHRGVTGAIVAGGANERFGGEPKGLRRVGGIRIIDRVASAIRAVTPDIVLVANAPDAEQWLGAVKVCRDVRSERGSVVGLHTGPQSPNGAQADFRRALFGFEHGDLKRMILEDKLDQTATIIFDKVERNGPVTPAEVSFTPPAGADVIGTPRK